MNTSPTASVARPLAGPHSILWIGPAEAGDMRLALGWAGELAVVHAFATPAEAIAATPEPFVERSPAVILVASDAPGRWSLDDLLPLALRWPLAPIVSVAGGLVDGRRRSGPALTGIVEVPWHELPGRLACWLADRVAGRPGTLGLPAAVRREDRILESCGGSGPAAAVSVAAGNAADLDGISDLVVAAGGTVVRRSRGRPPLDEPAAVLVWDVGRLEAEHVAWVRMLAANRPGLWIVLLESFPRPDTTRSALEAGAGAVLGRPASAETLAGTLQRPAAPTPRGHIQRPPTALSPPAGAG